MQISLLFILPILQNFIILSRTDYSKQKLRDSLAKLEDRPPRITTIELEKNRPSNFNEMSQNSIFESYSKSIHSFYTQTKNQYRNLQMEFCKNLPRNPRNNEPIFNSSIFELSKGQFSGKQFPILIYKGNDVVSESIRRYGSWDGIKTQKFYNYLTTAETKLFFDVGANIGWFSFAMGINGFEVLAFEPDDLNIEAFRIGLCLNNLTELVTLYPIGLDYKERVCGLQTEAINQGTGTFLCSGDNFNLSRQTFGSRKVFKGNYVSERLDEIQLDDIGVMKIDCDGCEPYVILGMERIFKNYKAPIIELEITQMSNDWTFLDKFAYLCSRGYSLKTHGGNKLDENAYTWDLNREGFNDYIAERKSDSDVCENVFSPGFTKTPKNLWFEELKITKMNKIDKISVISENDTFLKMNDEKKQNFFSSEQRNQIKQMKEYCKNLEFKEEMFAAYSITTLGNKSFIIVLPKDNSNTLIEGFKTKEIQITKEIVASLSQRNSKSFADVGSEYGFISLYLAAEGYEVFSFELNEQFLIQLQASICLNRFQEGKITLQKVALSFINGNCPLYKINDEQFDALCKEEEQLLDISEKRLYKTKVGEIDVMRFDTLVRKSIQGIRINLFWKEMHMLFGARDIIDLQQIDQIFVKTMTNSFGLTLTSKKSWLKAKGQKEHEMQFEINDHENKPIWSKFIKENVTVNLTIANNTENAIDIKLYYQNISTNKAKSEIASQTSKLNIEEKQEKMEEKKLEKKITSKNEEKIIESKNTSNISSKIEEAISANEITILIAILLALLSCCICYFCFWKKKEVAKNTESKEFSSKFPQNGLKTEEKDEQYNQGLSSADASKDYL